MHGGCAHGSILVLQLLRRCAWRQTNAVARCRALPSCFHHTRLHTHYRATPSAAGETACCMKTGGQNKTNISARMHGKNTLPHTYTLCYAPTPIATCTLHSSWRQADGRDIRVHMWTLLYLSSYSVFMSPHFSFSTVSTMCLDSLVLSPSFCCVYSPCWCALRWFPFARALFETGVGRAWA